MVDESPEAHPNNLGGMIVGIIDAQLMMAMAICGQLGIEPRAFAHVFRNVIEQQKAQGGPPDYVAGRHFAPESIAATLEAMIRPPPGRKAPPGRDAPFSVIHGGLVTPPAGEALDHANTGVDNAAGGDDAV